MSKITNASNDLWSYLFIYDLGRLILLSLSKKRPKNQSPDTRGAGKWWLSQCTVAPAAFWKCVFWTPCREKRLLLASLQQTCNEYLYLKVNISWTTGEQLHVLHFFLVGGWFTIVPLEDGAGRRGGVSKPFLTSVPSSSSNWSKPNRANIAKSCWTRLLILFRFVSMKLRGKANFGQFLVQSLVRFLFLYGSFLYLAGLP